MSDVSPKLNSLDQPRQRTARTAADVQDAAASLKRAVDDLALSIVAGSGIQRSEARDHFEIALAEFSEVIDRTAE